jgi:predicted permease
MRRLTWLEISLQDLRFGVRVLRRSAGFTAAAVLLLALGIGANTAIFSVISTVFLRALPFPDADRLVVLSTDFSASGGPSRGESSLNDYAEWKARNRSFTDLALMIGTSYNLTGSGEPKKLAGIRTTANLFSVLGMQPVLGRTLQPADDAADAAPVAVISERLWRTRFGADPGLVGQTLRLNGAPYTVAGIVPADFQFPNKDAVLWVPARLTAAELADHFNYFAYVVGRLKRDVSLLQAQADMTAIATQLTAERRAITRQGVTISELREHVTRDTTGRTLLLVAGALLILLITCANVAGLLLAHGAARRGELAVRNVLGANGRRLIRQLLTESLILAASGALLGVGLASLTFGYLRRLVPPGLPPAMQPTLDWRVLAFTAGVAGIVVLVIGTVPTLVAVRCGLDSALRSNSRRVIGHARSRRVLVVAELALTVVLVAGAGLLLRSYANVLAAGIGFDPRHLLLAETTLPPAVYAAPEKRAAFYGSVLDRVRALPGVTSAAYVNFPPLVFKAGSVLVAIEGQPAPAPSELSRYVTLDRVATAGYFETLHVPVTRGREFDRRDVPGALPVAIVNEAFARRHWQEQDPIGRRIGVGAPTNRLWLTVVGVVADTKETGLDTPPTPELYLAATQSIAPAPFLWPQSLVVRTTGDPMASADALRQAVWSVDPDQPVTRIRTMDDVVDAELVARQTQLTLLGTLAALALAIAAVGLYGLLAYEVSQRLREIGLRLALGAQRRTIVAAITRQSLWLVGLALAVGLAGALAATRLLRSWLFEVGPADPMTFAVTASVLVIAAAAACILPAIRAAGVEPAVILRGE